MPLIIPNGFGQVTLEWGGIALPEGAATVWGFNAQPGDQPQDIANGIGLVVETRLLPLMSTEVTLVSVAVKKGPNATGQFARVAIGEAGEQAGDPVSPAVSLLVSKTTGFGGRKNRGRMYLPGLREANISSGGVVASNNLASWQGALDLMLEDLETGLVPMVILHSSSSDPTVVTSLQAQSIVATQRQRQRR